MTRYVISIAPLIADAVEQSLRAGSNRDVYRGREDT
jgi:hypothetical protein